MPITSKTAKMTCREYVCVVHYTFLKTKVALTQITAVALLVQKLTSALKKFS